MNTTVKNAVYVSMFGTTQLNNITVETKSQEENTVSFKDNSTITMPVESNTEQAISQDTYMSA